MLEHLALMHRVMSKGEESTNRTGVVTKSLFAQTLKFPGVSTQSFPLQTTRAVPYRWVAAELLWQLSGSTDEKDLSNQGVRTWAPWATAEKCRKHGREPGQLGPVYGELIRRWQGYGGKRVDQLAWVCRALATRSDSRRLVVSQWDPATQGMVDVPPCQTQWQVSLRPSGRIDMAVSQRSADLYVGMPFDVAHFATLLCVLAWASGLRAGDLTFFIGDAHVYETHWELARKQLARIPGKRCELAIVPDRYDRFSVLENVLRLEIGHLMPVGYRPMFAERAEVVE